MKYRGYKANDHISIPIKKKSIYSRRILGEIDSMLVDAVQMVNWENVRILQAQDDGTICMYCKRLVLPVHTSKSELFFSKKTLEEGIKMTGSYKKTKDHIIPRSKLRCGLYQLIHINTITSCQKCNIFKRNLYPHQLYDKVKKRCKIALCGETKEYWNNYLKTIEFILA